MSVITIRIKDLHNYHHDIQIDKVKSIDTFYNTYDKRSYTTVNIEVSEDDINKFTEIKTEESKDTLNAKINFLRNRAAQDEMAKEIDCFRLNVN